jgi:hypothetical protein
VVKAKVTPKNDCRNFSFPLGSSAVSFIRSSLEIDRLDVVGRQHTELARPLHGAGHPTFVDGRAVDDQVSVFKGHLVGVLRLVVVDRLVTPLKYQTRQMKARVD